MTTNANSLAAEEQVVLPLYNEQIEEVGYKVHLLPTGIWAVPP